jgi:type I restriction enzyme S subunit
MSEANGQQLPQGWAMAPIEDLFWPLEDGRTLHQGWSPLCEKTPAPTDEDWGVLKTTAIQGGAFLPQHNKHLPRHLTPRPQTEVKTGDILITCAGPRVRCGVACMVRHTRPRLMMSGKMYRFRVSPDDMDARYLEAFLLTSKATRAIDKMKTGGSDSGLNLTHDRFRPLPVPVAPLNEQRRIMDTLEELTSDLDAGVAALERVQAKLKHYRAAVLKAAVEGALTTEWRAQHPATEPASALLTRILTERRRRWEEAQLQKFKEAGKAPPKDWKAKYKEPNAPNTASLPTLPKNWRWVRLGELLFEIEAGKSFTCVPRRAEPGEWGVIKVSAMSWGAFDETENKTVPSSREIDPYYEIKSGDILLSRANTFELVGASVLVKSCRPRLLLSDKSMRLLHGPSVDKVWLQTMLGSPWVRRQLSRKSTGTKEGMRNVSQESVLDVVIPLAPASECLELVEQVEDQLSVIEHLEADLEAKLKSAQALRQSILRHAFTGQLVPQDPNDEPAAELLKRIAAQREERARQAQTAKQTRRKPASKKSKTPLNKSARHP